MIRKSGYRFSKKRSCSNKSSALFRPNASLIERESAAAVTCFPATFVPNSQREVGGGRTTRQPGQVRKDAALTSSGSGRSSTSHFRFCPSRTRCGRCRCQFGHHSPAARKNGLGRLMTDARPPAPDARLSGPVSGSASASGAYRVLARKYRPASFDDLIGQNAMVRTISNAFESNRIPQAWILTGVRGVGKTTTARILARALNYDLPDGSVPGPTIHMPTLGIHCQAIMEGRHIDVLEMDAASHTGVDDVSGRSTTACGMRPPARATRSTSSTKFTC